MSDNSDADCMNKYTDTDTRRNREADRDDRKKRNSMHNACTVASVSNETTDVAKKKLSSSHETPSTSYFNLNQRV